MSPLQGGGGGWHAALRPCVHLRGCALPRQLPWFRLCGARAGGDLTSQQGEHCSQTQPCDQPRSWPHGPSPSVELQAPLAQGFVGEVLVPVPRADEVAGGDLFRGAGLLQTPVSARTRN